MHRVQKNMRMKKFDVDPFGYYCTYADAEAGYITDESFRSM